MSYRTDINQLIASSRKNGITLAPLLKLYGVYALVAEYGFNEVRYALRSHYSGNNPSLFTERYREMLSTIKPLIEKGDVVLKSRSEFLLQQLLSDEPE